MRRFVAWLALLAVLLVPSGLHAQVPPVDPGTAAAIADDAGSPATIAVEAYTYAYPLVLMELMRLVQTNAGDGTPPSAAPSPAAPRAPMNQFAHQRAFPDATTEDALRPNVDVLVSSLWFDVGTEPLVIEVPDAGGRYYAMPIYDLWSDVFAAPGPRTTGGGAQTFALTARGFAGMLPAGVTRIEAPTAVGLVTARILVTGPKDLDAAHRFQDGFKATPLGSWGKPYTPPRGTFDAARDMERPRDQILRIPAARFFGLFAELTARNPPHPNDHPILARLARIGIVPGTPFSADRLAPEVRAALPATPVSAGQTLFESFKRAGTRVNGWRTLGTPVGTYGTDYRRRQVVLYSAFGGELSEDTLAYHSLAGGDGKPLVGGERYVLHFDAADLPPAHAGWSVTLYDERQVLAPTKTKRAALGDRSGLAKNADGSIDIHLQTTAPAPAQAANWLPTPGDGRFSLALRLYWPKPAALGGFWVPPPVAAVAR